MAPELITWWTSKEFGEGAEVEARRIAAKWSQAPSAIPRLRCRCRCGLVFSPDTRQREVVHGARSCDGLSPSAAKPDTRTNDGWLLSHSSLLSNFVTQKLSAWS
jgi:hypothetical protein